MQRLPVESTDIISIGYDQKAGTLEIEFKEGRIYQYFDVEPDVYDRFTRTDSYGEYFYSFINKRYRYQRVASEQEKDAKPDKLAFVTGNARKLRDLQLACKPFGIEVEALELPVDEIQSHDAQEVATKKAKEAYRLAERPVVVNDTFWNILALRGFPGAYAKYIDDWFKPEDLLALMDGKADRTVICTDTLAYYDGKHIKLFTDNMSGRIAEEPKGDGLTLEQVLIMNGQTRTVAEIEQADGRSSFDINSSMWTDFAKWYNLRRRMNKI